MLFSHQHFPRVLEVGFTPRLEDQLDDIANGEAQWTAVMVAMWTPLSALVAQAQAAVAGQPKIRLANTAIPNDEGEVASPEQNAGGAWAKAERGDRTNTAPYARRGKGEGRRSRSAGTSHCRRSFWRNQTHQGQTPPEAPDASSALANRRRSPGK